MPPSRKPPANPQRKSGCSGCVSLILLATFVGGVGTIVVFVVAWVFF